QAIRFTCLFLLEEVRWWCTVTIKPERFGRIYWTIVSAIPSYQSSGGSTEKAPSLLFASNRFHVGSERSQVSLHHVISIVRTSRKIGRDGSRVANGVTGKRRCCACWDGKRLQWIRNSIDVNLNRVVIRLIRTINN